MCLQRIFLFTGFTVPAAAVFAMSSSCPFRLFSPAGAQTKPLQYGQFRHFLSGCVTGQRRTVPCPASHLCSFFIGAFSADSPDGLLLERKPDPSLYRSSQTVHSVPCEYHLSLAFLYLKAVCSLFQVQSIRVIPYFRPPTHPAGAGFRR